MPLKLDRKTMDLIRKVSHSDAANIIDMAKELGLDITTFFENEDWSGLDLRSCDLTGVSFKAADLSEISVYDDQLTSILATEPRRIDDPVVFQRDPQNDLLRQEGFEEDIALEELRQMALSDTFPFETLPESPSEAAFLLDANITKAEHSRPGSDDWYDAIKTRSLARIPEFGPRAESFFAANYRGRGAGVMNAELLEACQDALKKIPWIGEKFGRNQLKNAVAGKKLTFERATACVLGFNKLVVDDIRRAEKREAEIKNELDALGDAEGAAEQRDALTVEQARIGETKTSLRDMLMHQHSITICCFYFYEIWPFIEIAKGPAGMSDLNSVVAFLAEETGQTPVTILGLIGEEPMSEEQSHLDRATKRCASYPTMRSIFKALMKIDACKDAADHSARSNYIQRLHVGIGNKTAYNEEFMSVPSKITRPPYDWGKPAEDQDPYPA